MRVSGSAKNWADDLLGLVLAFSQQRNVLRQRCVIETRNHVTSGQAAIPFDDRT